MRFSPYQSRGSVGSPASRVSHVSIPNGGEQSLARSNGALAATLADGFARITETVEQGKALEANNEYNQIMSQGTAELMQAKEQEALNITDEYDKLREKTLADLKKKYGGYLKYGSGAQMFNDFTVRDDASRRANIMRYQYAQAEAYRTTQANNALAMCGQQAAEGGYTDESIDQAIERMLPIVGEQYHNYGKEKVLEQQRLAAGKIVGDAVRFAMNSGDGKRLQEIVDTYGKIMPSEQRSAVMAIAAKRQRESQSITTHNKMMSDLGWNANFEDVRAWVINNHRAEAERQDTGAIHAFYKDTKGTPYQLGGAADGSDGTFDCGSWTQCAYQRMGVQLFSRCADDQYDQMVEEGKAFHDPKELQDGDLVFWTETGGEEGENGVAHVGIYNAKTGKAMQSGVSGVGEIDVDTYKVVGFGRGTTSGELSPVELKEKEDAAWKFYREQVALRDIESSRRIQQGVNEMEIMSNKGITDPEEYDAVMNQYIYRPDGSIDSATLARLGKFGASLRRQAIREMEQAARRGGGGNNSGGNGKRINDPTAAAKIQRMLEEGMQPDETIDFITESNFSDAKSLIKMVTQDYPKGKGVFAEDWEPLEPILKKQFGNIHKEDFKMQWAMAKQYAYSKVQEYEAGAKGQQPTAEQRRQWLIEGFTEQIYQTGTSENWYGGSSEETEKMTNAALMDRGVESFGYNPKAKTQTVTLINGGGTFNITPEQYQRIKNGENARAVVFEP